MSDYTISFKTAEPHAAALGRALPVSPKHCQEICRAIRGLPLDKAKRLLDDVINMRKAIPFKQHYHNLGHRKGAVGPGRYPILACKEILAIVRSAESNAQFKGLTIGDLYLAHAIAQQGFHIRRREGHRAKRTHIEIVLMPKKGLQKEEKKDAKVVKKESSPKNKGASQ